MWLGTDAGLSRYDGYKFRLFLPDPRRAGSLGSAHIDALFTDRSGQLWIGTEQTLDRLDTTTETFTHYQLQTPGPPVIHADIAHIDQDHEGILWLATLTGLLRLDPAAGRMQRFQHKAGDPSSLASSDVKSTFEDREHRFWVATSSGLDELDRHTGHVSRHVPLEAPVREFLVHEDRNGLLWLAYASGAGAGLSTFNPETGRLQHYVFTHNDAPGEAYSGVYAIAEDTDGNLWFGTGGMGLLRLDRAGQRFIRYRNHPDDPDSLADDHITSLLIDREGHLWVGLNATAPDLSDLRPPPFRNVIHSLGLHGGGEKLVYCIFQDHQGELWVGTASGLFRLQPPGLTPTFVDTAEGRMSAGIVAIAEDASGYLWLGTVGQGLKRLDPRTGRVVRSYVHADTDPGSLSDDLITDLEFDAQGRLWLSTWNGLDELDMATGRFTVHKLDPDRRTEAYNKFVRDRQGSFWISSEAGIARFDPRNSRFTLFAHSDKPGTLSSNHISSVFIDSHGQVWAATQGGLNRRNADGSFSAFGTAQGLAGTSVSCILEDDAGELWLSTNLGLSRFSPGSQTFTNYSVADGVGDLLGWGACFRRPSGEMLFGGFTGLVAFNPGKVAKTATRAITRISDFKIDGQSVQIDPSSPLSRSISTTTEITLSHEQRNFSLEFAALNFLSASTTRYRYRMDGLDSHWNEVDSGQRVVSYTSLPSGAYLFRAQAAVGQGAWTEPGVVLRIHVLPPWWRTWWFTTLVGVLLALMGGVALSYRLRSIARQYEVRLEERVLERTRIARELHDSLLQGFQGLVLRLEAVRRLLPGRAAEAEQSLEAALERAEQTIIEGRDAVKDLRNSAIADTDLEKSLQSFGEELAHRPDHRPVSYRVLVQGKPRGMAPLVRDDVYQIAREAFRNAVQHAQARHIEAELEYGASAFHLRVRDDGSGIGADVLTRATRAGHWGLQGMRERADAVGGRLEIWSGDALGTEVHLSIPAGRAYGRSRGRRPPAQS
jgi:ligand-binding sensor domain-containing protein/signal transduction histidine kinase